MGRQLNGDMGQPLPKSHPATAAWGSNTRRRGQERAHGWDTSSLLCHLSLRTPGASDSKTPRLSPPVLWQAPLTGEETLRAEGQRVVGVQGVLKFINLVIFYSHTSMLSFWGGEASKGAPAPRRACSRWRSPCAYLGLISQLFALSTAPGQGIPRRFGTSCRYNCVLLLINMIKFFTPRTWHERINRIQSGNGLFWKHANENDAVFQDWMSGEHGNAVRAASRVLAGPAPLWRGWATP